jgi:hypothetical protein
VVEAHVLAVAYGAGREQTTKALLDRFQKLDIPMHVEKALLLAREARCGQVLGGRRRADGDVGEVLAVEG